jgi:hypothetical protein
MMNERNKAVEDYWFQFFVKDGHCSLCGNHGVIDSTFVKTPAGFPCGGLHFCICPNGQVLRLQVIRLTHNPHIGSSLVERAKKVVQERRDIIAKVGNHSWEWDGREMWEIICLLAGTEAK